MDYEKRIILFVDILGFANEVKKSNKNNSKIEQLKNCLEHIQGLFYNNIGNNFIEFTQFSDSIVISVPIDYPGGVYYTISDASFAIHSLFSSGFICKGNITIGNIYHKKDLLFGTGFMEAMKLEALEELPIIKFHKDLLEIAKKYPGEGNKLYPDAELAIIEKHIQRIENSDYFEVAWRENYADLVGSDNDDVEQHYMSIKKLIEDNIKNFESIRVLNKYLFLGNKFNNSNYYNFKVDINFDRIKYIKKYWKFIIETCKSYFIKKYWKNK